MKIKTFLDESLPITYVINLYSHIFIDMHKTYLNICIYSDTSYYYAIYPFAIHISFLQGLQNILRLFIVDMFATVIVFMFEL